MDKLKNEQAMLRECLSEDPGYILDKCDTILSFKEYTTVQKLSSPPEKIEMLLKTIIDKQEDACQSFIAILRESQDHYKQLKQFFSPDKDGSFPQKVFADKCSFVSVNKVNNVRATTYTNPVTIFCQGGGPSGTKAGPVPQAAYIATNGSAVLADQIVDSTIDTISFSTIIQPFQPDAGTVDCKQNLLQGPAAKMITEKKVELIDCLRGDPLILQCVHAKRIITDIQYQNLKHAPSPFKAATDLIDLVTGRGQKICQQFIEVLKTPDVLDTYPQLITILNIEA